MATNSRIQCYRGWDPESGAEKVGRWYTSDRDHAGYFGYVMACELYGTVHVLTDAEQDELRDEWDALEYDLKCLAEQYDVDIIQMRGETGDTDWWVLQPRYSRVVILDSEAADAAAEALKEAEEDDDY